MSQLSRDSSILSKTSSDIRLYERVRLQSFQGLLPGAQNRIRSPGRHPHVLLEDLLKAEVVSLQLVLAIENVAKIVNQCFTSECSSGQESGKKRDETTTTEDGSLKSFQSALVQSANALDELTKLQISDNVHGENTETSQDASSAYNNSFLSPSVSYDAARQWQVRDVKDTVTAKRLSYDSRRPSTLTPSEPSWSFSMRVSELSTTPSDAPHFEADSVLGRDTDSERIENGVNIEHEVKDTIKTLRNEMEELQLKHETQFINYAAKYFDLSQDENQNMRTLLEKIMENLSPQDQNWTHHGRFDEHGMEQVFYFVLLQKTLKSCLAIIDTINMEESQMEKEVQPPKTQEKQMNGIITNNMSETRQCSSCLLNKPNSCWTNETRTLIPGNYTTLVAPEIQDDKINAAGASTSQVNGKRSNEFDEEQEHKKQKKGKSLFACFNTRWPKRRQKKSKN